MAKNGLTAVMQEAYVRDAAICCEGQLMLATV